MNAKIEYSMLAIVFLPCRKPVCLVAGSDSVPDLGVSERLGARFVTVFEGSVPDLGEFGARFRGYGARFGHLFTVWCQIWVFGHRVVPDLGICSPCGARFGYFINLWCQIWAFFAVWCQIWTFFTVWCQIWALGEMTPGKRRLEGRNKKKLCY